MLTLSQLPPRRWGRVHRVEGGGPMARRLLDLGLIPGTAVYCQGAAPAGDPVAYQIRGAVIALRRKDATSVLLEEPT